MLYLCYFYTIPNTAISSNSYYYIPFNRRYRIFLLLLLTITDQLISFTHQPFCPQLHRHQIQVMSSLFMLGSILRRFRLQSCEICSYVDVMPLSCRCLVIAKVGHPYHDSHCHHELSDLSAVRSSDRGFIELPIECYDLQNNNGRCM